MDSASNFWDKINEVVMTVGPRLVGAIITLIIGWWIIKIIQRSIQKGFEKKEMEPSLRGFLNSMIGI